MTKKEIAYERIKNDIYCRRFHPGDKININSLSHQYEMSAIPIREALTLLENEDLVENSPYKGYIVKIPDFNDYCEFSLMRNELEALAIRYSILFLTDENMQQIKEHYAAMVEAYTTGDYEHCVLCNQLFYRSLYSFAPCTALKDMIGRFSKNSYSNHSLLLLLPQRFPISIRENGYLVEAFEAKDALRATSVMLKLRLHNFSALVHAMRTCLMKPNYCEEKLLMEFFTPQDLEKQRTAIIGKVEYWIYVFDSFIRDFSPQIHIQEQDRIG